MSSPSNEVSVLPRVRALAHTLGPSESRVAQVVLTRPHEVIDWSTVELALAAEVSPATVIRACKSLGFHGFQHLRLELARSAPHAAREESALASARPIFDEALEALRLASESVDPERIEAAATALRDARRVVLVGNGFSGPPLQDFAMRLSTLGRSAEAPIDTLGQQFAAHTLDARDACVVVSYSGANVQSLRASKAASERGATVILVTSFARSPIARVADIVLVTGPGAASHEIDPYLARLAHAVVLHAVHAALHRDAQATDVNEIRSVVADALGDDD